MRYANALKGFFWGLIPLLISQNSLADPSYQLTVTRVDQIAFETTDGRHILQVRGDCPIFASGIPASLTVSGTSPPVGTLTFSAGWSCAVDTVYSPAKNFPAGTYTFTPDSLAGGLLYDANLRLWLRGPDNCSIGNVGAYGYTYNFSIGNRGEAWADWAPIGSITQKNWYSAATVACDLLGVYLPADLYAYGLTVKKVGTGFGDVVSSPAGIDCGSKCVSSFSPGQIVTLTASPAAGSAFSGWTGTCSGSQTCEVAMDSEQSVTATFTTTTSSGQLTTRYRLYNDGTKEHLYTTNAVEYAYLSNQIDPNCCGWTAEGPTYKVPSGPGLYGGVAAVPNYRLYNPFSRQHHWTIDEFEYNYLPSLGWLQEGADSFIAPTQAAGAVPLFRLNLNAFGGLHLWTTDLNEVNYLTATSGWQYEGIAGYVFPLQ
jgi:hypothetical protein